MLEWTCEILFEKTKGIEIMYLHVINSTIVQILIKYMGDCAYLDFKSESQWWIYGLAPKNSEAEPDLSRSKSFVDGLAKPKDMMNLTNWPLHHWNLWEGGLVKLV